MPAAKSLGMRRWPRAGIIRMLPFLSRLGGPSAWHPGATRPCPLCSGGCPSLGPCTTLDPCYSRERETWQGLLSPLQPRDSLMSLFLEQAPSKPQEGGSQSWDQNQNPAFQPPGAASLSGDGLTGIWGLPLEGKAWPSQAQRDSARASDQA